jgi:hypothetical protein
MGFHCNGRLTLAAGLALAGCGHIPPDVTTRRAPRDLQPGPDHALLVVVQPQNSGLAWMVFTADGTPRCQVPPTLHCAMALAPGHHRLYASPSGSAGADVLDLEVVAARRYVATVSSTWGLRIEQLTQAGPASRLSALGEWLAREEAVLDDAGVERLRFELARFPGLVEDAEGRWRGYDAAHLEVHTITADESL